MNTPSSKGYPKQVSLQQTWRFPTAKSVEKQRYRRISDGIRSLKKGASENGFRRLSDGYFRRFSDGLVFRPISDGHAFRPISDGHAFRRISDGTVFRRIFDQPIWDGFQMEYLRRTSDERISDGTIFRRIFDQPIETDFRWNIWDGLQTNAFPTDFRRTAFSDGIPTDFKTEFRWDF